MMDGNLRWRGGSRLRAIPLRWTRSVSQSASFSGSRIHGIVDLNHAGEGFAGHFS
jgi:hypothetical protein